MKRLWLCSCLVLFAAPAKTGLEERLWQHRNLGKAFYENPTTQAQAVEQFRQALSLAPNSARERLNYGLALLRAGKTPDGVAELLKVQKQDPKLPHTWFNLGVVYRKEGDFEKAIPQFQKMIELVPNEPVSHYNLGVLFKQAGQIEKAQEQFETATRLNGDLAAPHFQLYNVYRQQGKQDPAAAQLATFQKLKKQQEGAAIAEDMEWSDFAEIYDPIDLKDGALPAALPRMALPPNTEGQLLLDADGDGKADILSWGKNGLGLTINGRLVSDSGLPASKDVLSAAAGDFDNDGWADLCILTQQGPLLYRNDRGKFVKVDTKLPAGRFETAVWLDYDHDYDLDLFLLGEKSVLLRNQGSGGFADHTPDFPFVAGNSVDGMLYRWQADSKAFDLVVSYQDHAGVLYADKLAGKFEAVPLPQLGPGSKWLRAEDVNHDSWLDIVSSSGTLLNRHSRFETASAPRSDGSLPGPAPNNSKAITVALNGVKNLKLAYGAEVEVKAGASYQKKIYEGVPVAFDLGGRSEADTIRITWPNGLIQNEPKQAAGRAYDYKEAQRLSGSCPMIWTWNGHEFQFITDVLGVAPLGASSGDGQYFATDHDEYIQIPGEALAASNGKYQIRLTEELSEVSYLDQIRLLAVDHPAGVEVFTSEKWKGPPFPDFRLYAVANRIYPQRARDGQGRDVLPKLLARDNRYADTFRRDQVGIAELHTLDLAFGAASGKQTLLILNGWVDWADGSTFLAASQEGRGGLIPPYLQVKDQAGHWQTVIEDMGMPDGKPKTIAVDLSGKFLSASRDIRIVTNMCVYWDEIFLGEDATAHSGLKTTRVPTASAEVRFRGFSRSTIHPERTQPESFYYPAWTSTSYWNPTPGLYTRYGDVSELVEDPDDRFVIMGAGDELRLEFEAGELPVLKPGWKRDFVLKVDGWAKDRDANTAHSQTVEPLPFHAMTQYPYGAKERYPTDAVHAAYRKQYNTRPALVLIRPLAIR
ncbi:MAG: tetratricopeptide repeat protein [Acidobacteriota bacterium]|nr:tetratricopeptide repeat protein [Acidobacteriota bacterium]